MATVPVAGITFEDLRDTFGADRDGGSRSHKGIDIFAETGTAVVAVKGGTVVKAGDSGGYGGLRAWVRDEQGMFHYYAHLNSLSVRNGQQVREGEVLGTVGQTGNAANTPPHLHYSVNPNGHTSEDGAVNPYEYLTGAAGAQAAAASGASTGDGVVDPAAPFTEDESQTMARIVQAISNAARRGGGKEIDIMALMGDGEEA